MKFITFEGIEGCGKSTQAKLFVERIKQTGRLCNLFREPGGTRLGEEIRNIVKHADFDIRGRAETLLFEAARAQLVEEQILPSLQKGIFVVCDRFIDSTLAYQGHARKIGREVVARLNDFSIQGREPDLTFLFDMPIESAFKRMRKRDDGKFDRIESEDVKFHHAVRNGFLAEKEFSKRIVLVDADRTEEEIHWEIWECAQKLLFV